MTDQPTPQTLAELLARDEGWTSIDLYEHAGRSVDIACERIGGGPLVLTHGRYVPTWYLEPAVEDIAGCIIAYRHLRAEKPEHSKPVLKDVVPEDLGLMPRPEGKSFEVEPTDDGLIDEARQLELQAKDLQERLDRIQAEHLNDYPDPEYEMKPEADAEPSAAAMTEATHEAIKRTSQTILNIQPDQVQPPSAWVKRKTTTLVGVLVEAETAALRADLDLYRSRADNAGEEIRKLREENEGLAKHLLDCVDELDCWTEDPDKAGDESNATTVLLEARALLAKRAESEVPQLKMDEDQRRAVIKRTEENQKDWAIWNDPGPKSKRAEIAGETNADTNTSETKGK